MPTSEGPRVKCEIEHVDPDTAVAVLALLQARACYGGAS